MLKPVKQHLGKVINLPLAGSAVAVKYGAMKISSGYLVAAATGDSEVEFIALETKTDTSTTDGYLRVDCLPIDGAMEFDCLIDTTPAQTDVGKDVDLNGQSELDLDGTTDKVFRIDSVVNATDKIVRGRFNKPALA